MIGISNPFLDAKHFWPKNDARPPFTGWAWWSGYETNTAPRVKLLLKSVAGKNKLQNPTVLVSI